MIRVLVVDDIKILCQGLEVILKQERDIEVIGVAYNGKQAVEACEQLKPDVVLMDMRMPDYDGAYGIRSIKEKHEHIKVLVLTTFDDEETIEKAVSSGADGYILKEMADEKVIASVKSVYAGISVFGNGVYQVMRTRLEEGKNNVEQTDACQSVKKDFTVREQDVLKLVAQGYDNKEIAAELCLAEGTVRNQISRLLEKLELKDRTQLAIYAVKNGLD